MFSQKFRAYVLDSEKAVDILVYLLCYGLEIKDKPRESLHIRFENCSYTYLEEQHGLCRALSYIIQTLSAEPAFGSKLSSQVKIPVPSKWATPGNVADFMITVRYVTTGLTFVDQNSVGLFDGSYNIWCTNLIVPCVHYRIVKRSPLFQESLSYRFEPSHPTLQLIR